MEKNGHVRAYSRGSLESSAEHTPFDVTAPALQASRGTAGLAQAKADTSSKGSSLLRSIVHGGRKTSMDEDGSGSSDEDAILRPRGSVATLDLSGPGKLSASMLRERQGTIEHFATLPRQHGHKSTERKPNREQASMGQNVMAPDLTSPITPVQNYLSSKSTEAAKTDAVPTTTTTTTSIWPMDTKFVSLDLLESFNKQLQMLAESEVDNEVDFYDKVISGLQEKIEELHDTILKVEHNSQLSVKMAEQRALEAETKLQIMAEKALKVEQRYQWMASKCKELEATLQKTAILQERDRAALQRSHLPQRVQSAREADHTHHTINMPRSEPRYNPSSTASGRPAERSPPQALRSDQSPEQYPKLGQQVEHPLGYGQHPLGYGQHPGQQQDRNPAQSQSVERNPNQTMRNPSQSQNVERNPNQGQSTWNSSQSQNFERNPNQSQNMEWNPNQGQSTWNPSQRQPLDRNPIYSFKQIPQDKSLLLPLQQTSVITSTETTV